MKKIFILLVLYTILPGCETGTKDVSSGFTELSFHFTTDTLTRELLNIDVVEVLAEAFISYSDIVSYNVTTHIFRLNHPIDSLFDYTKNYDGRGFVAMLDTTKIYCGVVFSPYHSSINPNIVITLPLDGVSDENCLEIRCGYPEESYYTGIDEINDERIVDLLKRDNKLIE
jgi:hypothetical protein